MKLRIALTIFWLQIFCSFSFSQNSSHKTTFGLLEEMLEGRVSSSFKEAVFQVENTFSEDNLSKEQFYLIIDGLVGLVKLVENNNTLVYDKKDRDIVAKYAALYSVMTDTQTLILGRDTLFHYPYSYDFDDIFGSKNWQSTFVTKLLETHKGNCHSLPYLYKILANELSAKAYLALAPNHIYLKHRCLKTGWYNTELTSASFPIDAWLMASGYISLQAVQNGIYLDTLSEKESIVLCVLDLAQGYNHKYPDNDGKFVIECCDLALKHFPDYVNAILLKAETRLKQLQTIQKEMKYAYLKEVTAMPEGKAKWDEMNSLYMQLYKLGYRQMPEQMYVEWLTSLKTEKEKYSNKNAPGATKD
jgi:hypothetical protein